jgi:hypothetical protein
MSITSDRLHKAFIAAAHTVRNGLAAANVSRFELSVKADGRTLTDLDEVKIEYTIEAGYDCIVKGNDLERCLTEVLRRKGWNTTNAPLSLPPAKEDKEAAN